MALSDAQVFVGDGSTRDFTILGEIPSESHVRVWIDNILQSSDDWDLLGNTVLLDIAPEEGTAVQFLISTTGTDFPANPTAISQVAESIVNVNKVADNISDVNKVAAIDTNVTKVADIDTDVNIVATDINSVNQVAKILEDGSTFGGGQYLGSNLIKAVSYMAKTTNENLVVTSDMNAFSINSIVIEDGGSITLENDAVYKVL